MKKSIEILREHWRLLSDDLTNEAISRWRETKDLPRPATRVKNSNSHEKPIAVERCRTCGAEAHPPPVPATKPAETGGGSVSLAELDLRISLALDRERAAERTKTEELFASLLMFSAEHLEEMKVRLEATQPNERAALAITIRSVELLQEYCQMIKVDLANEAAALLRDSLR